ncbi:glycine--tRNA ligase [soil metagenome]
MIDCKNCKHRMRADHLIEDFIETTRHSGKQRLHQNPDSGQARMTDIDGLDDSIKKILEQVQDDEIKESWETGKVEGLSDDKLTEIIKLFHIPCPNCKKSDWTAVRKFNQLFPVNLGIVAGEGSLAYLRGETAQGMFVAFKNVMDSTRVRLPFGIAQNGKSFRNEITPGNSVFRTLVFEQSEIEYFFDPDKSDWNTLFESWKKSMWEFVTKKLHIREENLRWREHTDAERSFYSKRTEDLEYQFPFGFKELWGLAYRTNYDLSQHEKYSGKDLKVTDPYSGEKILPHVIEPAVGIDRLFLMVLADAYFDDEQRIVLKINPKLAPYKVAVFPLVANKEEITGKAKEVYTNLRKEVFALLDERGNIGKRYLYHDEIGTPWCVTIDYQTLEDQTVTVRDRDTAVQERVKVEELVEYFQKKLQ